MCTPRTVFIAPPQDQGVQLNSAQLLLERERASAQVIQRSGSRETVSGKPLAVHHTAFSSRLSVALFIPISHHSLFFWALTTISQVSRQTSSFFFIYFYFKF
jgi:hypothetical protein